MKPYNIWIVMILLSGSCAADHGVVSTIPRLPSTQQTEKICKIEQEFKRRQDAILGRSAFSAWTKNKSIVEITQEFTNLQKWRSSVWYFDPSSETIESQPDFIVSQQLLINGRYRYPICIAFDYNNTDPSYNSSTIVLNNLKFLALEGPSEHTVKHFNYLLHNHKVTHLVRLTKAQEKGKEKCFAYWKDNVENYNANNSQLKIPLYSNEKNQPSYRLKYIWTDEWIDHAGGNAEQLYDLIVQTRNSTQENALIAVHCHSGIGRSGTFIAGYIVLDEIDRQLAQGIKINNIKVSVEKVVKQLSLQRLNMVAHPEQYATLYRLVDHYVALKEHHLKKS